MRIPNSLKSFLKRIPPIKDLIRQRDQLLSRVSILESENKTLRFYGTAIPFGHASATGVEAFGPVRISYAAATPGAPSDNLQLSAFQILDGVLEDFESWKNRPLFFNGKPIMLDNIYGCFQGLDTDDIKREGSIAFGTQTWHRSRALMLALTKALRLHPVLPWNQPNYRIRGIGLSDSEVYAGALSKLFDYRNTFFHQKPRLDICAEKLPYSGLDFIVSSDVFEHVPPPVEKAFQNCHRMLKTGGVLVFSVPYGKGPEGTIEHFPSLKRWHVAERRTADGRKEPILININSEGKLETFDELRFHGGAGQTLEMRLFGKAHLLELADKTGFEVEEVVEQDVPLFGIWYLGNPHSVPMIFRKR